MNELTEIEKKALALALFNYGLSMGTDSQHIILGIAEKTGITGELAKLALEMLINAMEAKSRKTPPTDQPTTP